MNTPDAVAHAARQRAGVPLDEPLPCLLTLVEGALALSVALLDQGDRLAGALLPLRPGHLALVNAHDAPARRRFTLAHELGHLLLGHAAMVDERIDLAAKDPRESAANAFASELLAPRDAVRRWREEERPDGGAPTLEHVVRLGARFGLSGPAALVRMQSAGLFHGTRGVIRTLREEIEQGMHRQLAHYFDLRGPHDRLASLEAPYLSPALRHSALGDYLAHGGGTGAVARATGLPRERVDDALRSFGLA